MHQHFSVVIHYKNATNNWIWNYTNLLHMIIVNLPHVSVTFCGNLEGGVFFQRICYKDNQVNVQL